MKEWEKEAYDVVQKGKGSSTKKHPNYYFYKRLVNGLERYPQLKAETSWHKAICRLNRLELLDAPTIPNTDRMVIVSNYGDNDIGGSIRAISKAPEMEHIRPKAAIINVLWNPREYVGKALGGLEMYDEEMSKSYDIIRRVVPNLGTLMEKDAWVHVRMHPLSWYKIRRMWEQHDWDVDHWPFLWHIPNRSGGFRGSRNKRQYWRGNDIVPWLYVRRGTGKVLPRPNLISYPKVDAERRFHEADLPAYVVQEILAIHNEPGWVIDPYCNGGTALRHAYRCGWNVLGIASDEREANAARHRITRNPIRPLKPRTEKERI